MKAAIYQAPHQPLTIEDVDIISPRAGEVLVRTVCSGVCHSDLHFVDGKWMLPMPTVLGHEASGVVEKVGEGVTYVQKGDHVIMSFRPFCGGCYYCLRGEPHLCNDPAQGIASATRLTWKGKPVLQFASVGSFSEMMVTHQNGVVKIPKDMPMAEAALIGCGVMTGVGAALYTAKVPGGAITAVIGCGGIGLNVIQGLRLAGASEIIAIDVVPEKLEMAKRFGATRTINGKTGDPVAQVKELTGRPRRRVRLRGDRQPRRRDPGLRDDPQRRHRRDRRHDAARLRDQALGPRLPDGEEGDRLHVRQHALPRAHAEADRSLPARAGSICRRW